MMIKPMYCFECPPAPEKADTHTLERVYLELTPACNSRCPGCLNEAFIADFSSRKHKAEYIGVPLSEFEWLRLIDRLPNSVRTVILSGGEPTLHPGFFSIVQALTKRNLTVVVFSNGRWQRPEQMVDTLKFLPNLGGMLVSLHGSCSASHEAFDGVPGSFAETCENIQQATASGIAIAISTVLTRQNFDELESMLPLALQLGAGALAFNRYLYTPERVLTARESLAPLTPPKLRQAVRRIEALRLAYTDRIEIGYGPTIPQCFEPSGSQACGAGFNSLVIDPWGNIRPCLHTGLACGNLLHQSFDVIWQSISLEHWRTLTDESCSGCSLKASCGGGCRAMANSWGLQADPLYSREKLFIPAPELTTSLLPGRF